MSHSGRGEHGKTGENKNYQRKILTDYLCMRYNDVYDETLQTRT